MSKFAGKVAIVTGGAAGIGGATSRLLAEQGASVLIADLNMPEAEANAEAIRSAGGTAETISTNVGRHEDITAMVQTPSTTGAGSTSSSTTPSAPPTRATATPSP